MINAIPGTRPRASLSMASALGFALWLAASSGGYAGLVAYAHIRGAAPAPVTRLLASSAIPRRAGKPTLVVVFHPECPCSRASVGELARLLGRLGERVVATALLVRPEGAPLDWERGELWAEASAIPGLTVRTDEGGALATELHARTSGYALLFDAGGELVFSGGITESRGHAGDAEGQRVIIAHVEEGHGSAATPVYGCPLFADAPGGSAAP